MAITSQNTEAERATRDFLLALTCPARTPTIPQEIRERAASLLSHYPASMDSEFIVQSRRVAPDKQNDSENNPPAYDEAPWHTRGWVERLLTDPQRTRDIVAKAGLFFGALLLAAIVATRYFLH